ncbi:hypothetical protein [Collinsella sp. An2]|uniref:hypothetical protein n=1 Tax=Collinsella sp. An2 TaxID=1965585 RepID=UPI000B383972|nr:hypothetical protein [Collinsella sp. An2]OUP10999.1 hypothetical protein B5F33_01035 [Collinsella sp. An2]
MNQVKFQVEGVEGSFFCDADQLTSYRTIKQFALGDKNPEGLFEALERVYMGKDEEYVDRVGGMDGLAKLNDAATAAVKAKNSSGSSRASRSTGTK